MALTAEMTLLACACGTAVGLVAALARRAPLSALRLAGTSYVEAIRNTPLLAQAFMIYFGIGSLGIRFDPLTAAIATLILNSGGYIAEIFRAGFESIHKSQREAAEAMGMTPLQAFVYVILPQATRNIYPALSAQYVLVMLGTSVMSQISAEELTAAASRIQSYNFRSLESYPRL
jgi:polar amino acid transport system permease protein